MFWALTKANGGRERATASSGAACIVAHFIKALSGETSEER
jgi:hypothetical protein